MQISIFITKNEIFNLIKREADKRKLYFAIVKYRPEFQVIPLENWEQFMEQDQIHKPRELWIDINPVKYDCHAQGDCCGKNPNRLSFQLPQMKENGLCEGVLSTMTEDEIRLKIWKSVLRFFRSKTTAGMWVLNPHSKAKSFYKHLRYSKAIDELHQKGLQLLPVAGWNLIFINKPV